MSNNNFNFLDEVTVESVALEVGVHQVQIANCSVYDNRILVNIVNAQGLPVTQVASFNCGTPAGLELARQFFGALLGANVKLRDAVTQVSGKSCKAKVVKKDKYLNVSLYANNSVVVDDEDDLEEPVDF